jgi:hypothetical protein
VLVICDVDIGKDTAFFARQQPANLLLVMQTGKRRGQTAMSLGEAIAISAAAGVSSGVILGALYVACQGPPPAAGARMSTRRTVLMVLISASAVVVGVLFGLVGGASAIGGFAVVWGLKTLYDRLSRQPQEPLSQETQQEPLSQDPQQALQGPPLPQAPQVPPRALSDSAALLSHPQPR